jgi:hypothetical protein
MTLKGTCFPGKWRWRGSIPECAGSLRCCRFSLCSARLRDGPSEITKSLRPRLGDALGEAQINTVAAELRALHKYHADSKPFRDEMAAFDHRLATFDNMWLLGGAGQRFPNLAAFCGTLASVFPNTATVESDFSIIGCEKRTCLTDLSLEGILHCKQWQRLTYIKSADGGSV